MENNKKHTLREKCTVICVTHTHTHTHCVWRSDFSKSSSCSSLPGARQGKNYDDVFSVSCLSKHTCKHTPHTHGEADSCVSIRVHASRKTKSTSCAGSSLFYWTIPNKMITLNLQRSLSACFSHNPVRLSPVNDSMRA